MDELPWYKGVHGEVVTADVYRVQQLQPRPDVVFDLGANVGVFTRMIRQVFPDCLIVSVEPNEWNFFYLKKFTQDPKCFMLNKAIGIGRLWHSKTAANGAHECYLSEGLGYDLESFADSNLIEPENHVKMTMPEDLVKQYVSEGQRYIFKIDIEGNEHLFWNRPETIAALQGADYIAMEMHYYAGTPELVLELKKETIEVLTGWQKTHWVFFEHTMLLVRKK